MGPVLKEDLDLPSATDLVEPPDPEQRLAAAALSRKAWERPTWRAWVSALEGTVARAAGAPLAADIGGVARRVVRGGAFPLLLALRLLLGLKSSGRRRSCRGADGLGRVSRSQDPSSGKVERSGHRMAVRVEEGPRLSAAASAPGLQTGRPARPPLWSPVNRSRRGSWMSDRQQGCDLGWRAGGSPARRPEGALSRPPESRARRASVPPRSAAAPEPG